MKQKIRKVVLALPNFRWAKWNVKTFWSILPYNLCLLTAVIEHDYDVVIIDANKEDLSQESFGERIAAQKPDVVGLSVLMDEYARSGHIAARLVKEINPNIPVILGGVYATMNHETIVKDTNIDYVAIGEGEYLLPDLLGYLDGRNDLPVKGLAYRKNGQIITTPRADFITDLDALPFPAYHKIDFLSYANVSPRLSIDMPKEFPFARIFSSRGCPIGCIFCQVESIAGKRFRYRSAKNVLDEIEWLKNTYGIKSILFDDDNLLANRKRAMNIFRGMIERKFNIPWHTIGISVFFLDEEMLEQMKASGCKFVTFAIESGCERVLREIIHKPVDLVHAKKMIKKGKKLGLTLCANFVIGFPGETWEEIRQTIRFAEEIDIDYVKIFHTVPLRHTKLYELAERGNYFSKDFSFENINWSKGQIETEEFTAKDLTFLRAYEWDRVNFRAPEKTESIADKMGITVEELKKIRRDTLNSAHEAYNT